MSNAEFLQRVPVNVRSMRTGDVIGHGHAMLIRAGKWMVEVNGGDGALNPGFVKVSLHKEWMQSLTEPRVADFMLKIERTRREEA